MKSLLSMKNQKSILLILIPILICGSLIFGIESFECALYETIVHDDLEFSATNTTHNMTRIYDVPYVLTIDNNLVYNATTGEQEIGICFHDLEWDSETNDIFLEIQLKSLHLKIIGNNNSVSSTTYYNELFDWDSKLYIEMTSIGKLKVSNETDLLFESIDFEENQMFINNTNTFHFDDSVTGGSVSLKVEVGYVSSIGLTSYVMSLVVLMVTLSIMSKIIEKKRN